MTSVSLSRIISAVPPKSPYSILKARKRKKGGKRMKPNSNESTGSRRNKGKRNISVIAENNGKLSGFNIFLDFSGKREYLVTHRHNGLIYNILKDGIQLDDLRRGDLSARGGHRINRISADEIQKSIRHLLTVIDEYLAEREEDPIRLPDFSQSADTVF